MSNLTDMDLTLSDAQTAIVQQPLDKRIWLEGIAGAGKTTVGLRRVLHLLEAGVPAESILIFLPQRSLAQPYKNALQTGLPYRGGQVTIHTLGSLSLQMVEAFWFLVAAAAGFKKPQALPNFLSLELVQYFMTRAIEPLLIERDYFNSVRISRARLFSQIVDNMNKAALVGFPINEIGGRLKAALGGGVEQAHIFDDAQTCAIAFRDYCLTYNLLDFSLYVEVFREHILRLPVAQNYLFGRYKHLIVDNAEEDNPASHRFLAGLLTGCTSALLLYDRDAGFRSFLGADPQNARHLRAHCDLITVLDESFVMRPPIKALGGQLAAQLDSAEADAADNGVDPRPALKTEAHRYQPQMVDWVAEQVSALIQTHGTKPEQIVVLAPFLSDVLRFGLLESLDKRGIQARSHRPSRALRDEPAARTLLTLARLAHPQWKLPPPEFDTAFALMTAIEGLDLLRAKLLTEMLYRDGRLLPFSEVKNAAMQDRITYDFGERYNRLRAWLQRYIESERVDAIDIFFRRIFGGLLCRAGYGFHGDVAAGNISMNLVDSARNFRWALEFMRRYDPSLDLGLDYVNMVERGLIADFYLRDWLADSEEGVLIAPAYTFLLSNRAVDFQFWLNVGSEGWSRRLYQPLTHPHVLSLEWQAGAIWTDDDEEALNRQTLRRLVLALTRRCRHTVYLGYSELSESGYEQRGLLLDTLQSALRRLMRAEQEAEDSKVLFNEAGDV